MCAYKDDSTSIMSGKFDRWILLNGYKKLSMPITKILNFTT